MLMMVMMMSILLVSSYEYGEEVLPLSVLLRPTYCAHPPREKKPFPEMVPRGVRDPRDFPEVTVKKMDAHHGGGDDDDDNNSDADDDDPPPLTVLQALSGSSDVLALQLVTVCYPPPPPPAVGQQVMLGLQRLSLIADTDAWVRGSL
jgi:hypothetical protein